MPTTGNIGIAGQMESVDKGDPGNTNVLGDPCAIMEKTSINGTFNNGSVSSSR